MFTFRNDATEFAGSVHQKVNKDLETAVNLSWTAGSNVTHFALGSKYTIDKDSSVNVRIENIFPLISSIAISVNLSFTVSALLTKTDSFANSVDPYEMTHNEPSHQDLPSLPFWF